MRMAAQTWPHRTARGDDPSKHASRSADLFHISQATPAYRVQWGSCLRLVGRGSPLCPVEDGMVHHTPLHGHIAHLTTHTDTIS